MCNVGKETCGGDKGGFIAGQVFKPKGFLFHAAIGSSGQLSGRPMSQADVYRMIQRRVEGSGLRTKANCHTFRATGITEYLCNGGKLEIVQQMANHENARTTASTTRALARYCSMKSSAY